MLSFTPSHDPEKEAGFYFINYFGLLYDTCNADFFVCMHYYITYIIIIDIIIYIIVDFCMTPAMQICVCACIYYYINIILHILL